MSAPSLAEKYSIKNELTAIAGESTTDCAAHWMIVREGVVTERPAFPDGGRVGEVVVEHVPVTGIGLCGNRTVG